MTEKQPSNEAMRQKGRVLDQRQQQIDPAGKKRVYNPGPGPANKQREARNPQETDDDAE